ncbi:hypothetical protein [Fictibacillus sp. KU28468]|uniref:hypothetical protein n=1 Tax=Fictibacillus sp. KU28468 TaxID=2991053 RepID=UPI00223D1D19|nr:hypothetical protein [Fictibacillus sp. KU28468]UZJ77850.1 hypothetical protein OKX00_17025 [Fictibacillus sp. KU28468]
MISVPGCSLLPARAPTFEGRAVILTGVNAYFLVQATGGSLTCHASPAGQGRLRQLFIARRKCEVHFRGVSHLPLQLTFH